MADNKRYATLLAMHARGAFMTDDEKAEMREMESRKKPKRVPWGAAGSKVVRKTTAVAFSRGHRAISVMVTHDGLIGTRFERERKWSFINAATVAKISRAKEAAVERAKKKAERKQRRQA